MITHLVISDRYDGLDYHLKINTSEVLQESSVDFPSRIYFFVTQENQGTTFTSHNSEIFNEPFFLELGNLTDGEYYFEIELIDWANNSNYYTYPLVLDRTLPEIDWDISPSNNGVLSDHRLGLSWTSSENIELEFQHNGELISEWNASYGGHFFELNFT